MSRIPTKQAPPMPSSPLAPLDAPDEVKRRKSHQWSLGPSRATPTLPGSGRSLMPSDVSAPVPNHAHIMLARRHSYQGATSRIPRAATDTKLPNIPGSSLSRGYFPPVEEIEMSPVPQADEETPGGGTSPRSTYSSSDSSDDEDEAPADKFPGVEFNENFTFDTSGPSSSGPSTELPTFNLNPFGVPEDEVEKTVRKPSVTFQDVSPFDAPSRTQSMSAFRPPSPYVPLSRKGSAKWTDRLRERSRTGSLQVSPAISRNPSFVEAMMSRRPSFIEQVRSPQLTPSAFAGTRKLGSFSGLFEGTAFYVKPTGRDLPSPAPEPPRKHGRYAHRVPRDIDQAIDFSRIRCPVPMPAGKAPILQREEVEVALSDAYVGRSYGVVEQGDPDVEEGSDSDGRTAFSDVELANADGGDDGYVYAGVPAAYEFVDTQIPCVVPDAGRLMMSPSEEHLLHHSMAHPWTVPPYNVTERPRRSPRATNWRAIQAAAGAVVVSALLVPFGAGFMVIEVGSFGVGSFGLLMVADFMFRVGAASLNRRRANKIARESPIAKGYESYTTLPRMNRPRLPECSATVVGYREDQRLWEECLESIKAQQYPVKHIVSVIDGNEPDDMAMVATFSNAFPENQRLVVHLPVLLSVLYTEKYTETLRVLGQVPTRFESFKSWMTGRPIAGHDVAHETALNYVLDYLYTKAAIEKWSHFRAICFTQPHAHKRHAMFTAFLVASYALNTKDALLTTDSDTRLEPEAASNLMAMLYSEDGIAGVTGDVDVDRRESIFPNVYALNNWFASNVDSPCQSFFGSVSRLSSPMAMYRVSDLMGVISPWIMQTHCGKEVASGEDRHLATELLAKGVKTAHTHAAKAYTDAPASYVRWIKQQKRWTRAIYREGLFSSPRVNETNPWLAIQSTRDLYYPAVFAASLLYLLYTPAHWKQLVIWLSYVGGAVLLKTFYAVVASRDFRFCLYPLNQIMFFLGVVPTQLWALLTTYANSWGTSARSAHEIGRSESFFSRTMHTGYLLLWYAALSVGLGYYLAIARSQPSLWLTALVGIALALHMYTDIIVAKFKFFIFAPRHLLQGRSKVSDVEAYPINKRRPSAAKSLRSDNTEDEQFEEDMAALPLTAVTKVASLYGGAEMTVFEAGDSRRPSLLTADNQRTTSASPIPVTPSP